MKPRTLAIPFFAALCLLLCGVVLHRQIAAHPVPPDAGTGPDGDRNGQGGRQDNSNRQTADAATSRVVLHTVQGQLDALRAGDGVKALSYGSRRMRRRFSNPPLFLQMVRERWPEFGQCRRAQFGPVWMDPGGDFVYTTVQMEGENGNRSRGGFRLIREGSTYRIDGVRPRPAIDGGRN